MAKPDIATILEALESAAKDFRTLEAGYRQRGLRGSEQQYREKAEKLEALIAESRG